MRHGPGPNRPRRAGANGHQRPQGGALGAGGSQAPVGPIDANDGPRRAMLAWRWKHDGPCVPVALCVLGKVAIGFYAKVQYRHGKHPVRLTFDECAALGMSPSAARAAMGKLVRHGFARRLNGYEYALVYSARYVQLPHGAQRLTAGAIAALCAICWHAGGVRRAHNGLLSVANRGMKQLAAWLHVHRDTLRRWYQQIDKRIFKRTPQSYSVKDRWGRWIRRQTFNRFTVSVDKCGPALDFTAPTGTEFTAGQGSGPESTGRERRDGAGYPVDNQGYVQGALNLVGAMLEKVAKRRAAERDKGGTAPGANIQAP